MALMLSIPVIRAKEEKEIEEILDRVSPFAEELGFCLVPMDFIRVAQHAHGIVAADFEQQLEAFSGYVLEEAFPCFDDAFVCHLGA